MDYSLSVARNVQCQYRMSIVQRYNAIPARARTAIAVTVMLVLCVWNLRR